MRSFTGSSPISGLLAVGLKVTVMSAVMATLMAIVMTTGPIASAQDATTK